MGIKCSRIKDPERSKKKPGLSVSLQKCMEAYIRDDRSMAKTGTWPPSISNYQIFVRMESAIYVRRSDPRFDPRSDPRFNSRSDQRSYQRSDLR